MKQYLQVILYIMFSLFLTSCGEETITMSEDRVEKLSDLKAPAFELGFVYTIGQEYNKTSSSFCDVINEISYASVPQNITSINKAVNMLNKTYRVFMKHSAMCGAYYIDLTTDLINKVKSTMENCKVKIRNNTNDKCW